MRLIHYAYEPFELEPRNYRQLPKLIWGSKPLGLWVSVEGDYDWKWFCEHGNFNLPTGRQLAVSYEVVLKKDARILHLKTEKAVLSFYNKYPLKKPGWATMDAMRLFPTYDIDWARIMKRYQGIIIAPYQWKCSMNSECDWYYGWDCASGCIWDIECIKEFNLIKI